jgi:hypothetical protein
MYYTLLYKKQIVIYKIRKHDQKHIVTRAKDKYKSSNAHVPFVCSYTKTDSLSSGLSEDNVGLYKYIIRFLPLLKCGHTHIVWTATQILILIMCLIPQAQPKSHFNRKFNDFKKSVRSCWFITLHVCSTSPFTSGIFDVHRISGISSFRAIGSHTGDGQRSELKSEHTSTKSET